MTAPTDSASAPASPDDAHFERIRKVLEEFERQKAAALAKQQPPKDPVDKALDQLLKDQHELPNIPTTPPAGILPPAADQPSGRWHSIPHRESFAPAPSKPEYQFDPALASQWALALAIAGFVWFSRRRLKWLLRKGFSIFERFIHWLHMPPDEKI